MIGENIRNLRIAKGLSIRDLGKKAGISGTSIWSYETGRHIPNDISKYKIARALECTYEDLVK